MKSTYSKSAKSTGQIAFDYFELRAYMQVLDTDGWEQGTLSSEHGLHQSGTMAADANSVKGSPRAA